MDEGIDFDGLVTILHLFLNICKSSGGDKKKISNQENLYKNFFKRYK